MKSWKKPTPDKVQKVIALLSQPSYSRYFFNKLENPLWVDPLFKAGFFRTPPHPRVNDRGEVRHDHWVEFIYLTRMSIHKEAQKSILDILTHLPDTDNVLVNTNIVDILTNLPTSFSKRLITKIEYICRNGSILLPQKFGELINKLCVENEGSTALRIARSIFLFNYKNQNGVENVFGEPSSQFSYYEYKELLLKVQPELVKKQGEEAVKLFCEVLNKLISFSHKKEKPEDISHYWRRAVEDNTQNRSSHEYKDLLVTVVRDSCQTFIQEYPSKMEAIIEILRSFEWHIFIRIILHLIRVNKSLNLARQWILRYDLFKSLAIRHEYSILLIETFKYFEEDEQNIILSWIDFGPEQKEIAENEEYRNEWKRDWLSFIEPSLKGQWQKLYTTLVKELGLPKHPEFPVHTTSGSTWIGPTSPLNMDEVVALDIPSLLLFIKTWVPPNVHCSPTPEGFGRVLSACISNEPERFADYAESFTEVEPTYVRSLFRGLEEAINKKKFFSWEKVLVLARWVSKQEISHSEKKDLDFDRDTDWDNAKRTLASLLESGLKEGELCIPFSNRITVWEILELLYNNSESPAQIEEDNANGMDPATIAINSTQGESLHAIMQYMLWVKLSYDKDCKPFTGFVDLTEVKEIFERILETQEESSRVISAVFGQWFPWIVMIDTVWAKSKVNYIFPIERERLFKAAWYTYLVFCEPYDDVLPVLIDKYAFSVKDLGFDSYNLGFLHNPNERLVEHILGYYWRGKINLRGKDRIIIDFYRKAPSDLLSYGMEYIGQSLGSTPLEVPQAILDRLKILWDFRKEVTENTEELSKFGWWFSSQKFDSEWANNQLHYVLEKAKKIDPVNKVIDTLSKLLDIEDQLLAKIVYKLIKTIEETWTIEYKDDEIMAILQRTLSSSDPKSKAVSLEIIDYLWKKGFYQFKELIKQGK